MTKTKQNLAKYNEARAGGREKLQALFDEKNKKRAAIKELFGDNPEEMKKQSKTMRTKLNAQWKEENKDLIAKYQELYQQKKLDEETFQKGLEEFRKLDLEIDEKILRDLIMGKLEKTESKTEKTKALEKERKAAAIAELDRLGMKTNENVEKINAIQFLDDKILIGNTPWAYENMAGGQGIFKEETNRWYYNFEERKAEAENQGLVLPTTKDFENTLKALPGQYSRNSWYKGGNILSIILGESCTGFCGRDGSLDSNGGYGYLGSVSEYYRANARSFNFDKDKGNLNGSDKLIRFVCRPLVKNS